MVEFGDGSISVLPTKHLRNHLRNSWSDSVSVSASASLRKYMGTKWKIIKKKKKKKEKRQKIEKERGLNLLIFFIDDMNVRRSASKDRHLSFRGDEKIDEKKLFFGIRDSLYYTSYLMTM